MSEFKAEAFTNEFGEVINPGDTVIFAATAWKQTTINRGVYEGYTTGIDWYGDSNISSVRVRHEGVTRQRFVYVPGGESYHEDTGKPVYSILKLKRIYKTLESLVGNTF